MIVFFQSPNIGTTGNESGLFELLLTNLNNVQDLKIFEQVKIVVPNNTLAIWLKDQIALQNGICANLDTVILLGPILQNIYLDNHPDSEFFDFSHATFIIYEYLCNVDHIDEFTNEIKNYIYENDKLNHLKAYQLASQLQQIFQEYLYLRTESLINLTTSNIAPWQKQILLYLFECIKNKKTFLDVYRYLSSAKLDKITLPKRLFIFGLTTVYPSQLQLIAKLSQVIDIYWYYQSPSLEYYGDVLSSVTKSKLENKLLRYPDLSLDDLYLTEANPLLANLGQQSREFIELLRANEIEVYNFKSRQDKLEQVNSQTYLSALQDDIRKINYRIAKPLRLYDKNELYIDPIEIQTISTNTDSIQNEAGGEKSIYDLPHQQSSIKINVCHNRMREVQVMFNEIADLLNNNPELSLNDILVTAPDIDDYSVYINAVFANETILGESSDNAKQNIYKIPVNITGNRKYKNSKLLEVVSLLVNTPFNLTVGYLFDIINQTLIQDSLGIDIADIDLIKKWVSDNKTYFGYDETDYKTFGYSNYSVHTFKRLISNLIMGSCLTEEVLLNQKEKPLIYQDAATKENIAPYDNLDNSQLKLCDTLIKLIDFVQELRSKFYITKTEHKYLDCETLSGIINDIKEFFGTTKQKIDDVQGFIQELNDIHDAVNSDIKFTLPIVLILLDQYINSFQAKTYLDGTLNCLSMQHVRALPRKCTYILGMNFNDFPRKYNPNQLSILAKEWYLADRNYNIEDKQIFLDIILATQRQLFISYIGNRETDNAELKPSTVVTLLLNTLGQSFTNFWCDSESVLQEFDYKNIICHQALHPFYKNKQDNFSKIWHDITKQARSFNVDKRFKATTKLNLTQTQLRTILDVPVTFKQIANTFTYTNYNLYRVLKINRFHLIAPDDINEDESFMPLDRNLAREVFGYFECYYNKLNYNQLYEYFMAKGIVSYESLGKFQFEHYYQLYQQYIKLCGEKTIDLSLQYRVNDINVTINDKLYVDNQQIVIINNFENIGANNLAKNINELPYQLKILGSIIYIILKGSHSPIQDLTIRQLPIILRQVNIKGEFVDFAINSGVFHDDADEKYKKYDINLLKYYIDSFSTPLLVHRKAIEEYAKTKRNTKFKVNNLKLAYIKAKNAYLNDFNNYDLDKIKQDLIFASIFTDYFEITQELKMRNDIVTVGSILATILSN